MFYALVEQFHLIFANQEESASCAPNTLSMVFTLDKNEEPYIQTTIPWNFSEVYGFINKKKPAKRFIYYL